MISDIWRQKFCVEIVIFLSSTRFFLLQIDLIKLVWSEEKEVACFERQKFSISGFSKQTPSSIMELCAMYHYI